MRQRTGTLIRLLAAWLLYVGAGYPSVLVGIAHAEPAQQGRLWMIEASGGETSYLFGTMHSEDPAVTRLPGPVRQAFDRADRLVLEMVMDESAMLAMVRAGLFEPGRDLKSVLAPGLYRETVEAMAAYGVPESVLRRHKPWMVFTTLMMPKPETGLFLDMQLYQAALAKGKPVSGLETAAEQIRVFDDMAMQDQIAILKDTLEQLDTIDAYFDEMREIYLSGDLDALARFSDAMMADIDPGLVERFNRRFVTERNHRMVERLQPYLSKGNAFVAVGALHLPGEEGIIALLREAGFEVERK